MKLKIITCSLLGLALLGCDESSKYGAKEVNIAQINNVQPSFMAKQKFELGGGCNMESISPGRKSGRDVIVNKSDSPIQIVGWGVDSIRSVAPTTIYLRLQDLQAKEYYALTEKVTRSDVVDYFKKDFYLESGYKVNLDINKMPPGEYAAMIVMDVGGLSILCSSGQSIRIEGESK